MGSLANLLFLNLWYRYVPERGGGGGIGIFTCIKIPGANAVDVILFSRREYRTTYCRVLISANYEKICIKALCTTKAHKNKPWTFNTQLVSFCLAKESSK